MSRSGRGVAAGLVSWLLLVPSALGQRSLQEYRYFRALSIDLTGRMPTRSEIQAFEQPGFDVDGWIDARLQGAAYADRVRRIYMDLLRLEVGPAFTFIPNAGILRRYQVKNSAGQFINVYYRQGQRRLPEETDGTFCLTQQETGLQFPVSGNPIGTAKNVSDTVLDLRTTLVKPWWLYRDYKSANPDSLYNELAWAGIAPGYRPVAGLLVQPPNNSQTVEVRICKEEASALDTGTIYASGRTTRPPQPPYGRLTFPPLDNAYATANAGRPVSCRSQLALERSRDCGCGKGLEHCTPGASPVNNPPAFRLPTDASLGFDQPFGTADTTQADWWRFWWSQEAVQFLDHILVSDRDFREILTGKHSVVNGPLVQYYRGIARSRTSTNVLPFGYEQIVDLFKPESLPNLLPHDLGRWNVVENRGPNASGILTMPIFLAKYGTERARAHAVWNAFACKDFVAENVQLTPSTEANLMIRPGCQNCHATLEPLSAYFARLEENNPGSYLPAQHFPAENSQCSTTGPNNLKNPCKTFYDPAFTNAQTGTLRHAYGSVANADAGPQGLAASITNSDYFPSCAVQNVASAFLGRSLSEDDAALVEILRTSFVASGYRMRSLVRALVRSDAYRSANNLSSAAWRAGGAP